MNSINVYEQLIPGLGQRFELEVDRPACRRRPRDGDRVTIAARRGQHHAIISVLTGAAPPTVTTQ